MENEKKWVDYTREELITLIDCSDKICEELILEATMDLIKIHNTPVTSLEPEPSHSH